MEMGDWLMIYYTKETHVFRRGRKWYSKYIILQKDTNTQKKGIKRKFV